MRQHTHPVKLRSQFLDGQADDDKHWWPWKTNRVDRKDLVAMAEKDVPVEKRVFGEGRTLRPSFLQPYKCQNVLIEGVSIRNSPSSCG